MGWWAAATFKLNFQKLWHKGGHDLNWRWWPWTILSTNPLVQRMGKYTKLKNQRWGWWGLTHQEYQPPHPTFFLASAELAETFQPADFMPPGRVYPTLQVRPLSLKGTTRLWHRLLLHIEMEPVCGLALPPVIGGKTEMSLWRTVAEPAPDSSLYSHTGKPHYEEPHPWECEERELWSLDLMMLPRSRIKHMCWNTSWVPNLFGNSIVQNVMTLDN